MNRAHRQRLATVLAAGSLFVSAPALMTSSAQGRAVPRTGIVVFEDVNYGGRTRPFTTDQPDLRNTQFDDHISSLIVAAGEAWEVCENRNYGGRCQVFSGMVPDLLRLGWNDRISSLRRARPPIVSSPRGIELFAGLNYTGQRVFVQDAVADMRRINFNDRAMSVRLPPGEAWEICVSADYDDCRLVTQSMPDLGALGISRLVSSVRPSAGRGGYPSRGRGPGEPGRRPELTLYDRTGFTGRSLAINDDMGSLGDFTDRAQSVRVSGGRWQLCDRVRYAGRCVVVTNDVRDLATLGIRDRVASVRFLGPQ